MRSRLKRRNSIEKLESRLLLSKTIYVDINAGGTTHDGGSWTTAFTDLQQGLAAAVSGDEMHVADGTYKPTSEADRELSFAIPSGSRLLGGYGGVGAPDPDFRNPALTITTLSGDIGVPANRADNSFHVLTIAGTAPGTEVDGVEIADGNSAGTWAALDAGAGLYNPAAALSVSNCVFRENFGGGLRGVLYCGPSASKVVNCTFINNFGGSLSASSSPLEIVGCRFLANHSPVVSIGSSTALLANCEFVGNEVLDEFEEIVRARSSSLVLSNCTFVGNSTRGFGGVINIDESTATITNSVIWGNVAPTAGQIYQTAGSSVSVTHTLIQGGFSGLGNIDIDPQFFADPSSGADGIWGTSDDDFGDLRLRASSPAVDAGDNDALPATITTDITGGLRYLDVPTTANTGIGAGQAIDLGAYEAIPELCANAGGPYTVFVGSNLPLAGSGASSVAGSLVYAWDLDADGFFDDGTGPTPTFSAVGILPGYHSLAVRVTDTLGRSAVAAGQIHVAGQVVYVDPHATGAATGVSWADAFVDLKTALNQAVPKQTICIADGVYTPTDSTNAAISFALPGRVMLLGGFAGLSDPSAPRNPMNYRSVLSGDIGVSGDSADNSLKVITAASVDPSAILDGFTITGARTAGMSNFFASPTILNCRFSDNPGVGADDDHSNPTFTNCVFERNSTGLLNRLSSPTVMGSLFMANRQWGMQGGSTTSLTDCQFIENGYGGLSVIGTLTATNCQFIRNTAISGAGVRINYSNAIFTNCSFLGNVAQDRGGGIDAYGSLIVVENCRFVGNHSEDGAALYFDEGGMGHPESIVQNCTFIANVATGNGGAVFSRQGLSLRNSILWGNSAAGAGQLNPGSAVRCSDVEGGYAGTGNIDLLPQIARNPAAGSDGVWGTGDDDYGDLRLRSTSPCLDAGENATVSEKVTTDLSGNPRVVDYPNAHDFGEIVDLGAYECVPQIQYQIDDPAPSLKVQFEVDVDPATLDLTDLSIINVSSGLPLKLVGLSTVSYDGTARTAIWVFAQPLPDGDYRATLLAGTLKDAQGAPMPSDLLGNFFVLAADANRDRKVDIKDLSILAMNWQSTGRVFSEGDFNYDGKVDAADLGILAARWQQTLPPPAPPVPVTLPRLQRRTPTRLVSVVP